MVPSTISGALLDRSKLDADLIGREFHDQWIIKATRACSGSGL